MIYLQESQALGLFRPSIVKIPGGMIHNCTCKSIVLFVYFSLCVLITSQRGVTLPDLPNAAIFMRGLTLLRVWEEMV